MTYRPYDPHDQTTWYNDDGTPRENPYKNGRARATKVETDKRNQARSAGRNAVKKPYVYPGFDPSSVKRDLPTPNPNPVKGKKKKKTPEPKPKYKISKEVAPDSSNLVDSVNISELYVKAKAKIVLALIRNSKTLLGRYDFSGIDRITYYSLDADNSARQSEIVVSYIRPKPTVSLTEVMEQDVFMKNVNKINNQLNDFVSSAERDNLFGYETNGGFYPGSPKIVNGQARYDLIFKFYSPSSKIYRYRLYEIS
jgi:hypothetical protein